MNFAGTHNEQPLEWWGYLILGLIVVVAIAVLSACIFRLVGAISDFTTLPSIVSAPYQVILDDRSDIILFKNYSTKDVGLEVDGYYQRTETWHRWEYKDEKVYIVGDNLTGFDVKRR
jgi:hypothetical protein